MSLNLTRRIGESVVIQSGTDALLRKCHDILDNLNADSDVTWPACKFCKSRGYGSDGLIHLKDCIITELRASLSSASNGPVVVKVSQIREGRVTLTFHAAPDVVIVREELL